MATVLIQSWTSHRFDWAASSGKAYVLPKKGDKKILELDESDYNEFQKVAIFSEFLAKKTIRVIQHIPHSFRDPQFLVAEAHNLVKEAQDKAAAIQKDNDAKDSKIAKLEQTVQALENGSDQGKEKDARIAELEAKIAELQNQSPPKNADPSPDSGSGGTA